MARIGILTCSNATQDLGCSSASCLADFRKRKGAFADYLPNPLGSGKVTSKNPCGHAHHRLDRGCATN